MKQPANNLLTIRGLVGFSYLSNFVSFITAVFPKERKWGGVDQSLSLVITVKFNGVL